MLGTGYVGALDLGFLLPGRSGPIGLAGRWAGGASVLWGDDTTTCFRAALDTDTITDRDWLASTFENWADLADDRDVVIEGDLVVATACAPLIP